MSVTSVQATGGPEAGPETAESGRSKKKLMMVLLLVILLGGAAYWFVLKPKPPEKAPEPGEVVQIEPRQVNLAGGHYLKIGIALQLTAKAKEADGTKAIDATIELFSGRTMEELTRPPAREKLKHELEKELEHLYEGDVMGVYLTDFVTQ